jgi:hypothetical protein
MYHDTLSYEDAMPEQTDKFVSWASILSSAAAVLGLIQSQTLLTALALALIAVALCTIAIVRQSRHRLQSASLSAEGVNLDSLNIANLRRRVNRSLVLQHAYQLAKIEGRELTVSWQYNGFCRAETEASIEFSVDSENNIPFPQLECFAYDLKEDPERLHKIRPILLGADGLSKKIAIPFLRPLAQQEHFSVLLNCRLPECVGTGVQYYASSLSFEQARVSRVVVHLIFVRNPPEWVRVYEPDKSNRLKLLNELRPFKNDGETCEYIDLTEMAPGQSLRIFVYRLRALN